MRRMLALVLLLATLPLRAAAPATERALPLHRFPASRAAQTDAAGFYHMPTAIGDDYFDGTDPAARVLRHLRAAKQVGARYLRCAFSWNGIEPEPGKYRWSFWDRLVELADEYDIELIPYVGYTPEWAARSQERFWEQPPRDARLYADFMHAIARRYRGRIRSWEIWNEPDLEEYWRGTPAEFAALVRAAAPRIREADPEAVIVLGGFSNVASKFAREVLGKHQVQRYVDVVAAHAYPESWGEERVEMVFEDWFPPLARLLADDQVDVWLNEMGYADYRYTATKASIYGVNVYYRHEHTPRFQAVTLFKMFTLALASGTFSLAGWYRVDDFAHSEKRLGNDRVHFHLGVLDARGRPKPAFHAFRFFNRLFDQPTRALNLPVRAPPNSQATVNVLEKKNGKLVIVAWLRGPEPGQVKPHTGRARDTRRETIAVQVPCTELARPRVYDVTGTPRRAAARFERGAVTNIALRGDDAFIAEFTCARD